MTKNKFSSNKSLGELPEPKTFLHVKAINGSIMAFDQDGYPVGGVIEVSAKTGTDCITELTLKCLSHEVE